MEIDGKLERICAIDDLSRRKWKEFEKGKMYTLYMDPENPKTFRCTTKVIYLDEFIIWMVGAALFYFGSFGFISAICEYVYSLFH